MISFNGNLGLSNSDAATDGTNIPPGTRIILSMMQ